MRSLGPGMLGIALAAVACGKPAERAAEPAVHPPQATTGTAAPAAGLAAPPAAPAEPNATTTALGRPEPSLLDSIPLQKALRDGGARVELKADPDVRFLVIRFPEAATAGVPFEYQSQDFDLTLAGGEKLAVFAVTTGVANPPALLERGEPIHFNDEISMSTFTPTEGFRFSVAFKVPPGSGQGLLRVRDATVRIRW